MSSARTISEGKFHLQKKIPSIEEELSKYEKVTQRVVRYSINYTIHKSSKDTCELNDQKYEPNDLEEDENEFMIIFFSFVNYEDNRQLNDTLCGYFQKVFSCLIIQIRREVILLFYFPNIKN